MSRYIEYDAIDYRNDKLHDKSVEFLNGVVYMAQRIEEAPSIDIVRCQECRYWKANNRKPIRICAITKYKVNTDNFCSYGERKE